MSTSHIWVAANCMMSDTKSGQRELWCLEDYGRHLKRGLPLKGVHHGRRRRRDRRARRYDVGGAATEQRATAEAAKPRGANVNID